MDAISIIFWVLATYSLLVFVVLRLVVPFMGFGEFKLPKEIPYEIKNKINELEVSTSSQEQYLKTVYNIVTSRWHAGRMDTVYFARLSFRKDLSKIWQQPGYAHCNTQNYMLFVLLAGSKFFKQQDVKTQVVFFNFFIHQYLKVKVGDRWVEVDPAGATIRGKPFGRHISFFWLTRQNFAQSLREFNYLDKS